MCFGATPGPVTLGLSAGIRTSKRRASWRLPTSWKRTSLATAGCEQVVALGAYSGTYKATARSLTAPLAHLWTVRGGKIPVSSNTPTLRSARDGAHRRLLFGRRSLGIILNQQIEHPSSRPACFSRVDFFGTKQAVTAIILGENVIVTQTRVRIPLKRLPGSCHTLSRESECDPWLTNAGRASPSTARALARLPHTFMSHQRRVRLRVVSRKIQPQFAEGHFLSRPSSADVKRFKWRRAADENRMICARESVANIPRLAKVPSFLWRDWNVSLTAALARVNDPLSSGGTRC